ncbi:MAG: class I SAM-dependent methyltransferase [Alphaproteobacteria bacterium]|nr:class I SAM-dependent methyltransferase [Alphaproteobacteria bacterium]
MARLYHDRADLYDVVYQWKDYGEDIDRIEQILREEGVPPGARVLEAACGTGNYLVHLQDRYRVAGFDLSPEMAAIARAKVPGAPVHVADMTSVDPAQVGGDWDAVVCLFSGIGYIWPQGRLTAALAAMGRLLRPGGVLLIEPWLRPDAWRVGKPTLQTVALPDWDANPADLYVARGGVSAERMDGDCRISVIDLHYLVIERDRGVEHFVETHELWLCPPETLVESAGHAGLRARYDSGGLLQDRGLLVARRPG